MDISLSWKGRMTFEGAGDSGFVQRLDSEEAVGGDNSGARPMELIAIGLAGCTAMDVIAGTGGVTTAKVIALSKRAELVAL